MKARKGEEGWRGRVTRTGESPLTKRRPRNTIRESNHRMKGMKGVSQIKSARSTAGTKKGSRISLPLGRRLALEIRKRFFAETEMLQTDTPREDGEPAGAMEPVARVPVTASAPPGTSPIHDCDRAASGHVTNYSINGIPARGHRTTTNRTELFRIRFGLYTTNCWCTVQALNFQSRI